MAGDAGDCFLVEAGRCFRYRAGAVILHEGRVLMATNPNAGYVYSIGGAVRIGETAAQAAEREVLEETSVPMKALRPLFVHENFFDEPYDGRPMRWHELSVYYLMEPGDLDGMRAAGVSMTGGAERLLWLSPSDFREGAVFPSFLPDVLFGSRKGARHVVTRDGADEFIM